jgi:hypothetical protein
MEEPRHPVSGIDYPRTFQVTLINGLAAKTLALNILRNFGGLKALFAPVVEKNLNNAILDGEWSFPLPKM